MLSRGVRLIFLTLVLLGIIIFLLFFSSKVWANTLAITLVAAGIPGIYYSYKEWVMRPILVIGQVEPIVAPMKRKVSVSDNLSVDLVRPEIFYRLNISNEGRVSAKDCMVRIKFEKQNSNITKNADARWAVTDNPERYTLLPGEGRFVHLFKFLPSPERQLVIDRETRKNEVRIIPGLQKKELIPSMLNDFKDFMNLNPKSFYPMKKPPERREVSIGGDWLGRKLDEGRYEISVKVISQAQTKKKQLRSISLPCQAFEEITKEENWKDSWQEILEEYEQFRDNLISSCKDYIKRNC